MIEFKFSLKDMMILNAGLFVLKQLSDEERSKLDPFLFETLTTGFEQIEEVQMKVKETERAMTEDMKCRRNQLTKEFVDNNPDIKRKLTI